MKSLNKNSIFYIISTIALLLLTTSCESSRVYQFSIDYMQPAKQTLSPKITSIAMINNIKTDDITNQSINLAKWEVNTTDIYANMIASVAETEYFDKIIIAKQKWINPLKDIPQLSKETAQGIIEDLKPNAVVALEQLNIEDLKTNRSSPYYIEGYNRLVINPAISVYENNTEVNRIHIDLTDTIYVPQSTDENSKLHPAIILDTGNIISKAIADILATAITPTWTNTERFLFSDEPLFKEANKNYIKDMFEEAAENCIAIYEKSDNDKNRMKAAHNTAIYNELQDNLLVAKDWILKAIETGKIAYNIEDDQVSDKTYLKKKQPDFYNCLNYLEELNKRIKQQGVIDKQLSKFEE